MTKYIWFTIGFLFGWFVIYGLANACTWRYSVLIDKETRSTPVPLDDGIYPIAPENTPGFNCVVSKTYKAVGLSCAPLDSKAVISLVINGSGTLLLAPVGEYKNSAVTVECVK